MILHNFYRALRRREGGGGTPLHARRRLRRELRFVKRNPDLVIDLFLLQQGCERKGDTIRPLSPRLRRLARELLRQRTHPVQEPTIHASEL